MIHLDLALLRTFVAIVDDGGFGRAARRLNCTQSTASLHVRRLEEAAGARLIDRGPRRLRVTPAGETLLGYARRLLALHDEARAHMTAPRLSGTVTVGVSEDFADRQLPRVFRHFAEAHPAVSLEVRAGLSRPLRAALKRRELDLLVSRRAAGEADGGIALWREPLVWADGGEAPERQGELPLVLFGEGCTCRDLALAALVKARKAWRVVYVSGGLSGVQAAVAAGLGVSPVSRSAVVAGMRLISGLPDLPDTEVALYRAPRISVAAVALGRDIETRLAAA